MAHRKYFVANITYRLKFAIIHQRFSVFASVCTEELSL